MRRLVWFAAPFAGAVFLAVYLLPAACLPPAGLVCALASLAGLLLRGDRRRRVLLAGLGLAAGLLWTGGYQHLFHASARTLAGTEGPAAGVVADWPQASAYGSSVLVWLQPVEGFPVKTLLYLEEPSPDLAPGDRIRFTAAFRLADTVAGEDTYYYYAKGILLTAGGDGPAVAERPVRPPLWSWPAYVSRALRASVENAFPSSAAPLISALITGDTSGLDAGWYADLRRTGLAHVVAVSGLHVSFLAGLVTTLLGNHRRRSALVGILLLFFFAAAAGNTPSVLRAAFMQSMLLLAPLLGREDDKPTSLCAILFLLLLCNPFAAASVSLQLSFSAVAGIYLFTQPLCRRWQNGLPAHPKGLWPKLGCRAARVVTSSLAVSLGAIAFTTPLLAYYFRSVSLIAPLTNLLALWAVSAAFLGGLVTAAVGLAVPALAGVLALPFSLPVWYLQWLVSALGRLPFAAVSTQPVYLKLWLGLVYALLLLYLLPRGGRKRPLVPLGLGAACLCAALVLNAADGTGGRLAATVLDVGQGLSVALYTQGHTALIDCGGSGSADAGDVAADHFQALGANRLDVLILTHCHTDHASGVPRLLERMEVGLLVLPDVEPEDPLRQEILALAEARDIPTLLLTDDGAAELGDARLTLYAPLGSGDTNEEGLSVLCTAGDFDLLVTGDMNATIEGRLVKYGALPDLEALVVGHHGSRYAASEELLLAARPEIAVISVGYNHYGHPADETLERLAAAGCQIYRTDWSGSVTITVK